MLRSLYFRNAVESLSLKKFISEMQLKVLPQLSAGFCFFLADSILFRDLRVGRSHFSVSYQLELGEKKKVKIRGITNSRVLST